MRHPYLLGHAQWESGIDPHRHQQPSRLNLDLNTPTTTLKLMTGIVYDGKYDWAMIAMKSQHVLHPRMPESSTPINYELN